MKCYNNRQLFLIFIWFFILTTLSGCALFGPKHTRVEAIIESSPDINPNVDGKPSPLVIRIYELKSIDVFQSSDFFSLYDNEAAAIGKDILAKNEFDIRPGERYKYQRNLHAESRYIGVIAAYRNLDNSQWRATIEVPQNKTTELIIRLGSLAVSINTTK